MKQNYIDFRENIQKAIKSTDRSALASLCSNLKEHVSLPIHDYDLLKECIRSSPESLDFLVRHGFSVDSQSKSGSTLLIYAADIGNFSTVERLIRLGADVNFVEDGITTPLTAAAKTRSAEHVKIIRYLIEHKANINFVSIGEGLPTGSALTDACWEGNSEATEILINAGANINQITVLGTPLTIAVEYGHSNVVKILLNAGANVDLMVPNYPDRVGDIAGKTALQIARLKKKRSIIKILSEHKDKRFMSNEDNPSVQLTWDLIDSQLTIKYPEFFRSLQKPVIEEDLLALSAALQHNIPQPLVDCLKRHDGQSIDGPYLFESGGNVPEYFRFLSAQEIVKQWRLWIELSQSGEFIDSLVLPDKGVSPLWFDRGWIPFTISKSGDHHCIDCHPTTDGKMFQIILLWHDRPIRPLVSRDLATWLTEMLEDLRD